MVCGYSEDFYQVSVNTYIILKKEQYNGIEKDFL